LFHGSKKVTVKPKKLSIEQEGNIFLIANVAKGFYSIAINNESYNIGVTIYEATGGYGLSYATIPVKVGDEVTINMNSSSYSWVVAY